MIIELKGYCYTAVTLRVNATVLNTPGRFFVLENGQNNEKRPLSKLKCENRPGHTLVAPPTIFGGKPNGAELVSHLSVGDGALSQSSQGGALHRKVDMWVCTLHNFRNSKLDKIRRLQRTNHALDVLPIKTKCHPATSAQQRGCWRRRALPRGRRFTGTRKASPYVWMVINAFIGARRLAGAAGLRHDQHISVAVVLLPCASEVCVFFLDYFWNCPGEPKNLIFFFRKRPVHRLMPRGACLG